MKNINILWLYSDLLDLYGDNGNITALKYYLDEYKINYFIDQKNIYDEIDFSKYQLVYCGPGKDKNLLEACKNIIKYKNDIKRSIDNDTIYFITGNAQLLFGQKIDDTEALGIFKYEGKLLGKVFINDYICTNNKFSGKVYGFINRTSIMVNIDEHPLFQVDCSQKDIGKAEGIRYNNYFGSWALGPVLAKNPNYLSYILSLLLNKEIDINDELLNIAYRKTLNEFENK